MDKQPVGTLPDLTASSLDDEIMIITDSERSTLQKEKVSDFLTDITSTDENNSLIKGNDGKLFVSKSIEATDIEGVLDISNIPDIPLTKLPDTGVSAGAYQNPRNLQVNSKGLVISVDNMSQGEISDITPFITNCILANNGAKITKQSYENAAYVNNGCSVSEAGVASGFGANNFILLNKTMTDANAFVMTVPFKVNSTAGIQPLAAINNQDNCIQLDNGVLALKYNGLELKGAVTVSAATQYYAVLTRTETGYTLELKNSLEEATEALDTITLTSTAGFFGGKSIYLGVDKSGNFLNGEIDLAQLVITAGGEAYWSNTAASDFETVTLSGSLQVLMPDGRNADQTLKNVEQTITLNDVLLFNNSTGNAKTVLVKQNGEVMIRDFYAESDNAPEVPLNGVWFDTDSNVMNTQLNTYPNFINTGVTIESGVVSGFSAENYLQLPEQYNLGGNWSISLVFTPAAGTEETTAAPCGLVGNITVSGENYIPDGVGLVYDGESTITAVFRRDDVYNVRKTVVLSTAYEVQKDSDATIGYVQTAGESGSYVAADTQVYQDSGFSVLLETAAADTWQYTGETQDNTQTIDGFTKTAGSTLVPAETVIYADANCTSVQGTASGTDYVYTGATSVSIIGTLTDTVTAGQENSVVLSYDGANYKLNQKTLASTDNIRNTIAIPLGKALSTGGYFTGTINLSNSAFSFWTWNGVGEAVADLVPFVGVKIGEVTVNTEITHPNINIEGTLTNNNGVLSGFSSSNYALTDVVLPSSITSYEFVAKFTTGSDITTQQGILANSKTNSATPQIIVASENTFNFNHPVNSTTWVTVNGLTPQANTTYWVKATWDGTTISGYYKTSEEAEYTLLETHSATTIYWVEQIGIGIDLTKYPFSGSIDLNESYININGEQWWKWNGLLESKSTYSIGSVDLNFPLNIASKYDIQELKNEMLSKADVNLGNVSSAGKANIVALGMPDYEAGVEGVIAAWTTVEHDCFVVAGATLRGKTIGQNQGMEWLSLKNSSGQLIPACSVNDNGWISVYQSIYSDGYVTVQAFVPKGYSYFYYTGYAESQGIMVYPLKGAI